MKISVCCMAALLIVPFSACTDSRSPIDKANDAMKSQLASDTTITIDKASERYFPLHMPTASGVTFDYVCGQGVLNQPGLLDNARQRFIIDVNTASQGGMALFDGSSDPADQKEFDHDWAQKCPGYALSR